MSEFVNKKEFNTFKKEVLGRLDNLENRKHVNKGKVVKPKENMSNKRRSTEEIVIETMKSILPMMLNTALEPISKDINLIKQDINNLKTDMVEVKNDINVMKNDINNLKTDMVEVKNDINNLKTDMVEVKNDINVMKNDINNLKEEVNNIKEDVYNLKQESNSQSTGQ